MPENNPKIIKELPKGDYSVQPQPQSPKLIKELPKGSYSVSEPQKSSGSDYSFLNDISKQSSADEIINRLDTKNDDEKKLIKNIAIAEQQGKATRQDLVDAILTVQGQHSKQEGGKKYYVKEVNGVFKPVPLRNDEAPPQGYNVASIWGDQDSANDDSFLKSAAKHIVNGVLSGGEAVINLPQIAYGAVTGEELPWYQTTKNTINYLKLPTSNKEKQPIFNSENLKGWGDFFDPERYDFNKNSIRGAMLNGLESITSFLSAGRGLGTIAKSAGALAEGAGILSQGASIALGATNSAKLAKGFSSSYLINYDEALDAAEQAGLEGRDKYAFASVATIPTALLEMAGGNEATFVKNSLAREGKKQMFNSLAKGLVKDAEGKITKESLEGLYNATTTAAKKLNSTFVGDLAKNVVGEAGTEAAQAFALNSAKNIYDKIKGEEKFKSDPFSLESFGDYVNNFIAGGLGGVGPGVLGVSQKRKQEKADLQSQNAFEAVRKGTDAVSALKADIDNSVATGDLTQEQADVAKFKLDAYSVYNEQTKKLNLDEKQKREAFDLSFTIEGIKSEIPTEESELKKLSPIEMAKVQAKRDLVKGLQKDLDAIILKENVQKEPVVSPETEEKVKKADEKEAERNKFSELKNRYKTTETETEEPKKASRRANNPKFDAKDNNGNFEFNKLKPLERKEVLHDYFDENPQLNNEMEGFIEGGQNNVWKVDLGGTKRYLQFARSIVPDEYTGDVANFPGGKETVLDRDGREYSKYSEPVGIRLENIASDTIEGGRKRVLNIYNKSTGKHIAYGKETEKGNSRYSDFELKQLEDIAKRDNRTAFVPSAPGQEQVVEEPTDTLGKFTKSSELYKKVKEAQGGTKKRTFANQRRDYLNANPSIKRIEDNMRSIVEQLEEKGLLTKEGDCF